MTKEQKEYMSTDFSVSEVKNLHDDKGDFGFFSGYAATFGNIDRTDDVITKGAFQKTIANKLKLKMFWQHSSFSPIGSFHDMVEDDKGLFVTGRVNLGTQQGKDAFALLKANDIEHMSIGFVVKDAEFNSDTGIRVLKELELFEISIVSEPANLMATVTDVKALLDDAESLSDIETILKVKGFSNKEARALVSKVKLAVAEAKRDVSSTEDKKTDDQRDVERKTSVDAAHVLLEGISDICQQLKM